MIVKVETKLRTNELTKAKGKDKFKVVGVDHGSALECMHEDGNVMILKKSGKGGPPFMMVIRFLVDVAKIPSGETCRFQTTHRILDYDKSYQKALRLAKDVATKVATGSWSRNQTELNSRLGLK